MHRRPKAARWLPERGRHRGSASPWPRRSKVVVAVIGLVTTAAAAVGVSSWVVSVTAGSSGEGQAATIANLAITATASPGAGNLLSPGSTGDVVLTVTNSNNYPVTITSLSLPTNTTYATGYTNSALVATQVGCLAATPSLVGWSYATGVSGSSHTLTTPLVVAASGQANNPLVVTLTNDASMGLAAPLACAGAFFALPSFTGITATGGPATATTSPTTDAWTS